MRFLQSITRCLMMMSLCILFNQSSAKTVPLSRPKRAVGAPASPNTHTIQIRPWTSHSSSASGGPPSLTLETKTDHHFMTMDIRGFHDNCDGQCFYHKGDPANPTASTCSFEKRDCNLVASIARHPFDNGSCPFVGTAMGGLHKTLCPEDDDHSVLYTVSLMRHVRHFSCKRPYSYDIRMSCYPKEFVAISFSSPVINPDPNEDGKLWYVCILDTNNPTSMITYWKVEATGDPVQLKGNLPYGESAPGVLDTWSSYEDVSRTFTCRFHLIANKGIKYNNRMYFPKDPYEDVTGVKIKLAQGRVERNKIDLPKFLHKFRDGENFKSPTQEELDYYNSQQKLKHPIFYPPSAGGGTPDEGETLIAEKFETIPQGGGDTIDFKALKIETKLVEDNIAITQDLMDKADKEIKELTKECTNPSLVGKIKCFVGIREKNCIHRSLCHALVYVTEVKNGKAPYLLFKVFSNRPHLKQKDRQQAVAGQRGWAAAGFSHDAKMGHDLVVACVYTNTGGIRVLVSWNVNHHNEYRETTNQNLIRDPTAMYTNTAENDRLLCSWKMDWKWKVIVDKYEVMSFQGAPVQFDLETKNKSERVFILAAAGTMSYGKGQLGYHNIYNVIMEEPFHPSMVKKGTANRVKRSSLVVILSYALVLLH